jgi:hypothetical protein
MPSSKRKLEFWGAIVVILVMSTLLDLSGVQAKPPLISFTPLAADQLLWESYARLPVPSGHQTLMAVRLVPFTPGRFCWVDVLVTQTKNGGGMFQRSDCNKPPTGDFTDIGSQQQAQMRRFQRSLESPRYRRYDRTRFGSAVNPGEGHNITYMSQEVTLQVESSPKFSPNRLPTAIRSVLDQFWIMLSENVV